MKKLLLVLLLLLAPSTAFAQCNGIFTNGTVCGNVSGVAKPPYQAPLSAFALAPGGASGNIQINDGAGGLAGITDSQAATRMQPFIVSVINLACQAAPTVCQSVFGYANAAWWGVVCDGVANNTTAFAAAIASFPASGSGGGTLYLPPGVCLGQLIINRDVRVIGAGLGYASLGVGRCGTEIRGTTAAGDVVTLSSLTASISDICATSTIAAGSRTGSGIVANGVGTGRIERVYSYGHLYGIIVTNGGGTYVGHSFVTGNTSFGVWQSGPNNENTFEMIQSNGNGSDGFRIEGTGLGTRITNITAAANTGYGVNVVGTNGDVWLNSPEISVNVAGGINVANNSDVQIVSCFCEGSSQLLTITNSTSVSVTGGFYQGAPYGVVVGGSLNVAVTGVTFYNQTSAAMRHGAGSSEVSYTGNTTRSAVVGILIDATSGIFSLVGNAMSGATTPISGAANIAVGSAVCGNSPIATTTQGSGKCY